MSAGTATKSPFQLAFQRLIKNRVAVAGALVIALMVFACLLLPLLLGLDPDRTQPELRNLPPSSRYWFGTDTVGRDMLARVLIGGRASLMVGLASTAGSVPSRAASSTGPSRPGSLANPRAGVPASG